MKISFIGHAAILVETRGISILSDPWWQGPCFGVQWWIEPEPWLAPIEGRKIDFIYVSHGHHDHLHHGTLSRLPRSAKVLVSDELDLHESISSRGFECVLLARDTPTEIAPGRHVEITPTHGGDTLMVIDDGAERCVNLNDALHAAPEGVRDQAIARLRARYGTVDYVFCGYGTASFFPNCFQIPGKDDAETARRRQAHFSGIWADIVSGLRPRMAFPFAADVALLQEELLWTNEVTHNANRPTEIFEARYPQSETVVHDIAPGFVVEDGKVTREVTFSPCDLEELRQRRQDDIRTASEARPPTDQDISALADLLRNKVDFCADYLREHDGDYRFLIALKSAASAIEIRKSRNDFTVSILPEPVDRRSYELVFSTRAPYLRRALRTPFGAEVIFVGSGGLFAYRDRATAETRVHRELMTILRHRDTPPKSRFGNQPRWLGSLKKRVKAALGAPKTRDLYNLNTWTVYKHPHTAATDTPDRESAA